jgi:hypothetical protein
MKDENELSKTEVQELNDTLNYLFTHDLVDEELVFNIGGVDYQMCEVRTRDPLEHPIFCGLEVPTAEPFEFPISWELVQKFYETVVQYTKEHMVQ